MPVGETRGYLPCTELQWLLSPAAPAKTRLHGTYCSEDMDSHKRFRPCSSPLSTFMLSTTVSFFLHESIVSTTFLDIQIIEMGAAPTVSKSEMKPRSINSAFSFSSASYRAFFFFLFSHELMEGKQARDSVFLLQHTLCEKWAPSTVSMQQRI